MSQAIIDSLNLIRSKIFSGDDVITDNFVFCLHRMYSVSVLVVFSILLSLSQYVGDPIDCMHHVNSMDSKTFDTFCWVEGTYTKRNPEKRILGHLGCNQNIEGDCWHHKYYQWVALVLICQAGCFFLPRFLWQTWEDGKIKALISGLDRKTLIRGLQTKEALAGGEIKQKIMDLVANWKDMRGTNNAWAIKYYICELLNLANVVVQFKFTDFFLDGEFSRVAFGGLGLEMNSSILPITASCFFNATGSAGAVSSFGGLCVLPLNMVNQKFYTLFWFWLSVLLAANAFMITFRLIVVVSPEIRDFILRYVYRMKEIKWTIAKRSSHGDWLLLTFLLDNMNVLVRSEFIKELGQLKHYDEDAH